MDRQRIRIIRKKDDYSMEYQVGDIFTVDSTWYGGVNVTSRSGIPLSLDRDEVEVYEDRKEEKRDIDPYSYSLGAMDCFCEMVAAGLKTLAMSHPCDTVEERDSYLEDVKRLCEKYGVKHYREDEAFLTDLFPVSLNKDKYNYLFYRTGDVLDHYLELKKRQRVMMEHNTYTRQERYELAMEFGRLLSYPEDGILRLIQKAGNYLINNEGGAGKR